MKSQFKSATTLKLNASQAVATKLIGLDQTDFEPHSITQPLPSQRASHGLIHVSPNEYALHTGVAVTLKVEFAERVLPASVLDRKVSELMSYLERTTGHRVGRKVRAELREVAEDELLPKAFVRHSHVPVTLTDDRMIVWSSSAKKVETVAGLIHTIVDDLLGINAEIQLIEGTTSEVLTGLADDDVFRVGTQGVMEKGDEKVRLKNLDLESSEVTDLINQGFQFTEIELAVDDQHIRVDTQLVIKGISIKEDKDDIAGTIWLARALVDQVLKGFDTQSL